ncbi:response regulator [Ktedonospora formicarum]|uniref:Response regulatory domain-containing protein n=1 Tax=Ktedonospora formicarum TaxID=2778364 RepID=A0A8J3HW89_9CHLR|nr:response regulator [Ktedonospora formicarum]GHO45242.1 hypothetical protein KSX_34050 [Ktedonospora formicarum]
MSSIARIFVIEDDDHTGQQIVNALRNDGYGVWGVTNGGDAVRALWSEEYDAVICDLDAPGIEGFELLQWLRAYRQNTRMVVFGGSNVDKMRMQSLENGADSYLEKPLDVRKLREELRRLQNDAGLTVDLDSFDLLDVIQVITMSRKNIALLVNTGLEERGILRFQTGELVWAEYGFLRGEEAFFALAAHKNGTVTHQPWNGQVIPNVKLPLSRLIMQALQYRATYGQSDAPPQPTGAQPSLKPTGGAQAPLNALSLGDEDDTPFGFISSSGTIDNVSSGLPFQNGNIGNPGMLPSTEGIDGLGGMLPPVGGMAGQMPIPDPMQSAPGQLPTSEGIPTGSGMWPLSGAPNSLPAANGMPPLAESPQIYSTYNDEQARMSAAPSKALDGGSGRIPVYPLGQHMPESGLRDVVFGPALGQSDEEGNGMSEPSKKEWWERTGELPRLNDALLQEQSGRLPAAEGENLNANTHLFAEEAAALQTPPVSPASEPLPSWLTDQPTASNMPVIRPDGAPNMLDIEHMRTPTSSSEWAAPDPGMVSGPIYATGPQSMLPQGSGGQPAIFPESPEGETILQPKITSSHLQSFQSRNTSGPLSVSPQRGNTGSQSPQRGNTGSQPSQGFSRRSLNYPALVSALQTLGYSVKGFIAAAVVGLDGQPIAQIAVDDMDITPICAPLSAMINGAQQGAELGNWGICEDVLLRSAGRYIMARIVGSNRSAFLVVITTREAEPLESLLIAANIESAVNAALS